MKYIFVFIVSMIAMYLMASFIMLAVDFSVWDQFTRALYGIFSPLISVIIVVCLYEDEKERKEVITRDPKTGRFKKC